MDKKRGSFSGKMGFVLNRLAERSLHHILLPDKETSKDFQDLLQSRQQQVQSPFCLKMILVFCP